MSQRFFFSSPGCGWTEVTESHYLMLTTALSLDPAAHEGWRLMTWSQFIPYAVIV